MVDDMVDDTRLLSMMVSYFLKSFSFFFIHS